MHALNGPERLAEKQFNLNFPFKQSLSLVNRLFLRQGENLGRQIFIP
jgi:hypothetical protein